jgi:hypothetical protein
MRRAHEALQGPYAVPDESLEFFRVYREDVSTHIPWERDTLAYWACTTERQLTAAKAFRTRLRIEQQLLVRLHTAVTTETTPLQIP